MAAGAPVSRLRKGAKMPYPFCLPSNNFLKQTPGALPGVGLLQIDISRMLGSFEAREEGLVRKEASAGQGPSFWLLHRGKSGWH